MIKTKILVRDMVTQLPVTDNPILDFEDFDQYDWVLNVESNFRTIRVGEEVKIKNANYKITSIECLIIQEQKHNTSQLPELQMEIFVEEI